jgi:hypothetical protein
MKNIQVIDDAENCTYSIFSASEEDFSAIFPNGTDIEFSDDFFERVGEMRGIEITGRLWSKPVAKSIANGIHGTLYYQMPEKKAYFPTKKEAELVQLGTNRVTVPQK